MSSKEKIQALFTKKNEYSIEELHELTQVSKQMIHRVMNQLVAAGELRKVGKPPKTVYQNVASNKKKQTNLFTQLTQQEQSFLQEHFIVITALGEHLKGQEAFLYWCDQRNLRFKQTVHSFIKTKKKYDSFFNTEHLIDGMRKLESTKDIGEIWLDELLYLDFYAIERFGKTKLGTLIHFAKQTQSEYLMALLFEEIQPRIKLLLKENKFNAVGFIAPTIKRKNQIMFFLEKRLNILLPKIDIKKLDNRIPIPQKSLNKLEERVQNAKSSFKVNAATAYKHVLLIDDAVGSGTTLNEVAGKIKYQNIAQKITGLAIVGSFKGFDVVTDL